jgi:hypothetical protein
MARRRMGRRRYLIGGPRFCPEWAMGFNQPAEKVKDAEKRRLRQYQRLI